MIVSALVLVAQLLHSRPIPENTPLQIRLTTTVGSYAGRVGDRMTADLIAPVELDRDTVLPAGAKLEGVLKSVQRVGFGVVHETAALGLSFNRITFTDPAGKLVQLPLSAAVHSVDMAREAVAADGSIRGQRKTATLAYRVGGYIRTAIGWEMPGPLALWAVKMLLVQVPEPELYYPAGVEMSLQLTRPLLVPASVEAAATPDLLPDLLNVAAEGSAVVTVASNAPNDFDEPPTSTDSESEHLQAVLEQLPERTVEPVHQRPSDLVNFMFIGTHGRISRAFEAAGWEGAHRKSMASHVRQIRAVADGNGYRQAPMSKLLLNGAPPDITWQKGFNDPSKRHHIRIWKQPGEIDGQEIWVGAATRDIDFAFMRRGHTLTHKIDSYIDTEREKILTDLVYTQCVQTLDSFDRTQVPGYTHNATGDLMLTDSRIAVLKLNECVTPRRSSADEGSPVPPRHGNGWQRFARREVLSFRNDMMRDNIYWRAYEIGRMGITMLVQHEQAARAPRNGVLAAKRSKPAFRHHTFVDLLK